MRKAMCIMVLTGFLWAAPAALIAEGVAASSVKQSDTRDPRAPSEGVSAIHAALESGDPQTALALLQSRTMDLSPAESKSLEGRALLLSGKTARARKALEAAVRQRPSDAVSLYWLGRAYQTSGSFALAAAQFDRANLAGLRSFDLHLHWAQVLRESGVILGDAEQRRVSKAKAKKLQPGEFFGGGLIVTTKATRRSRVVLCPKSSALHQVYLALAVDSEQPDALLLAGELWAEIGRHKEALAKFKAAAGHVEGASAVRCHQGWAASLLATGDLDGYIEHSGDWMAAGGKVDSSTLAGCYASAAAEAARRGHLPQQIRYLTLAVELKPTVDDLLMLADVLLQAERPHDAERYLRQAKELETSTRQKTRIERYQLRTDYRKQVPPPRP